MNETMKYIVVRLIERANESINESNTMFGKGRTEAFYEMLSIIQSELLANDEDVKEFGLDVDLEKMFIN